MEEYRVNKESIPLFIALLVPIVLVSLVLLYYYGFDITDFFRKIDLLYYIIIIPFVLGFIVVIIKFMRPD